MSESDNQELISIYELLVRTSFQILVTKNRPTDSSCDSPSGFGSGFWLSYKGEEFFVTADHVLHLDDYEGEPSLRGKEYVLSLRNHIKAPNDFLSTMITPLGDFQYMRSYNLDTNVEEPIDFAVCRMSSNAFEQPFLTERDVQINGEIIKSGQEKIPVIEEDFAEPDEAQEYLIFGSLECEIINDIQMNSNYRLKSGLRYVNKIGDFFLFNTPSSEFITHSEWRGLSGSPVFSLDGKCIGMLCSIKEDSNSIWVIPIRQIIFLVDMIINLENV